MNASSSIRDHILAVASGLFYEHGIRSVGVDWVIKDAEVAKATLYRHFPNKEELVLAYLEGRRAAALSAIRDTIAAAGDDPVRRAVSIFDRLAIVARHGFRGCAFLRAQAEHLESGPIHAVVKSHKDAIKGVFEEAIADFPVTRTQRRELAAILALIYDGALAVVMVQQDIAAIEFARRAALAVLCADHGTTARS
ncbi:TPA: TetR/AcrR family transcriptional regulator [Burkholderia cenocepacia]|nr:MULTISPECIES: TetR/AcrR family transcriptional regulator [Burkholderia]UJH78949.1 TetR/AcrR family transcriptional regulator [Burkholderia cenocepacia]